MHFNFLSPSWLSAPTTTSNIQPQANFISPSPCDSSQLCGLLSLHIDWSSWFKVSLINCMAAVFCGPLSLECGQVNCLWPYFPHLKQTMSVISLSFPTVLSSVAIHITISTSDCVGPGNILSSLVCTHSIRLISLWPPYVIGAIIFLPCSFFLSFIFLSFFFSSPNLSGHRLDVYRTSTHGVALVRI